MKQLGQFTFENRERAKTHSTDNLPVYGVARSTGLTPKAKYQSKDLSKYKIVRPGMFAYNPMRLNIGSIAYSRPSHPVGLVSPDYVVFSCDKSKLDHSFMKYVIEGTEWNQWTTNAGVGSVRIRIYYKELAKMPFTPPFSPSKKLSLTSWAAWMTRLS
jgi:type I restriction enzyme S subunit